MKIHRAVSLGLLHQELGIDPEARITYKLTDSGIVIRDLATGTQYTVTQGDPNASVARFEIPKGIKQIISSTDDELKKRYSESWEDGWSDEREAIFTELTIAVLTRSAFEASC